jgi:hypothetical protein
VGVDERGNARELHTYLIYIARPKTFKSYHSPTPHPLTSITPYTHPTANNSLSILVWRCKVEQKGGGFTGSIAKEY